MNPGVNSVAGIISCFIPPRREKDINNIREQPSTVTPSLTLRVHDAYPAKHLQTRLSARG